MKTKNFVIKSGWFFTVAIIFTLFITSCEKTPAVQDNTDALSETSIDQELYTSEVFDEVIDIADEAEDYYDSNASSLKSATFGFNRLSECVTVTKEKTDSLVTTVIDFGEENCLCNDGRERRGKIIMSHEGRYWDSLVYITFTFDNFFVDDNMIMGDKSVTQTIDENGNRVSTISISGSMVLADGSGTISYESDKTRTIIEGSDTPYKRDDVIETTGSSTCTLADGTVISMNIIEPLVRKNEQGCFMYIVQGILENTVTGKPTVTINFGDGTCDNYADVTVDGVTTTIELKRKCNGGM